MKSRTTKIQKSLLIFVVISIFLGITHDTAFSNSTDGIFDTYQLSGTRHTYELKIEVDYFEGLLTQEVIEGFEYLESYFETRGIPTEIDFNSTNNVVVGHHPNIGSESWRAINYQYHDQPTTHIYFLIAETVEGHAGKSHPYYGPAIGLRLAGPYDVRSLIMHEFGHAIGIGLQDDIDEHETYSDSGFMGYYQSNITEYKEEDWNASFAPDGAFGNQTWRQARMWNRYSIIGEIYDDTSDVFGNITGELVENGPIIYLREINGSNNYVDEISPIDGTYSFQAKPGNYTLEVQTDYQLEKSIFVNVTEREAIYLENISVEYADSIPVMPPTSNLALMSGVIFFVVIVSFVYVYIYRKSKSDIK